MALITHHPYSPPLPHPYLYGTLWVAHNIPLCYIKTQMVSLSTSCQGMYRHMQAFYAIKQPWSGDGIKGTHSVLANKTNAQRILHNHANGFFRHDIKYAGFTHVSLYCVCCGTCSEFQSNKIGTDCRCRGCYVRTGNLIYNVHVLKTSSKPNTLIKYCICRHVTNCDIQTS